MFVSRQFRTLWLAALAVLAIAQVLHAVDHLNAHYPIARVHQDHNHEHNHCHDSHSHSSEPYDAPAEHCHLAEHSHSPAIVDADCFIARCKTLPISDAATFAVPEAPVAEIEYPPQLS